MANLTFWVSLPAPTCQPSLRDLQHGLPLSANFHASEGIINRNTADLLVVLLGLEFYPVQEMDSRFGEAVAVMHACSSLWESWSKSQVVQQKMELNISFTAIFACHVLTPELPRHVYPGFDS